MLKKMFYPLLLLFITIFCMNALDPSGLELHYRNMKKDVTTNSIFAHFDIVNNSSSDITLSDLAIRYYFTMENPAAAQEFKCYYARIGSGNVSGSFVNTGENNYYLEITFAGASGIVRAGDRTGEIQANVNKSNWSNYNQADDYSFNPDLTSFTAWDQVTLFYDGQLVWGNQPGETPVPPAVSITAPVNNDTVMEGETVIFSADADDADGEVTLVEFMVNGTKAGEDSAAPYEIEWVASSDSAVITAVATDNDGNTTVSSPVSITIQHNEPVVNLVSPVEGQSFVTGGTVTMTAEVVYPDSISGGMLIEKVEFYANSLKVGESLSEPFTFDWLDVETGSYSIVARGTDGDGNLYYTEAASISVAEPVTSKLKVQYQCLEAGSSSNSIRAAFNIVNLDKNETVPMEKLAIRYFYTLEGSGDQQFHCDHAVVGASSVKGDFVQQTGDSYYVEITFTGGSIGPQGQSGEIQTRWHKTNWTNMNQDNDFSFNPNFTSFTDWTKVELYRDGQKVWPGNSGPNEKPTAEILAPTGNEEFYVGEDILVSAKAEDTDGEVQLVEFIVDDLVVESLTSPPYQVALSGLEAGMYVLEVLVTDDLGAAGLSEPVLISVIQDTNIAPTAELTAPVAGTEYETGETIAISVNAADEDGTVSKVEFYAGGIKIGEDALSPYTMEWSSLNPGTYSLTAKAIDNKNKAGYSEAIEIVVAGNQTELPYSSQIRLNQAGYKPGDGYKTAVMANMSGTFTIHSFADNTLVYSGTLTNLGSDSGETLSIADFSDFSTPGTYYIKAGAEKSARFDIRSDVYNEVLYYTLRVYGANRCGDYDSWIHEDCHTLDGSIRGAGKAGSLTGGWHDCGDHVKFGGTLGYAADMMLYSYVAWPEKFGDVYSMSYDGTYRSPSPDGIPDVINESKVATDYILNLYNASVEDGLIAQNKMYYQVGDGDEDHSWWHLPQYQDGFSQAKGGPDREIWSDIGSDIAGRYAAALAMMAEAYKTADADYAADCINAAKDIYTIGANVYGSGGDSGGKGYYGPDGRMDDDMAFAATMIYRATGDEYYINNTTGAAYWMAKEKKWDFISYHVLSFPNIFSLALHAYYPYAAEVDGDPSDFGSKVVTKAECIKWLKMEAESTTQIDDLYGRKWKYDWGTCRYMMGLAASAVMAHSLDPSDERMMQIAKDQMNWVLGRNQFGLSFVVGNKQDGWLTRYPEHPHHRAANPEGDNVPELAAYPVTELTGATIGGPESHTEFTDVWDRYQSTETGIDYWAGTFFTASYFAE